MLMAHLLTNSNQATVAAVKGLIHNKLRNQMSNVTKTAVKLMRGDINGECPLYVSPEYEVLSN